MKCGCEWPNSCILCSCKASVQTVDPATMSLEERVALLDAGFHPILSLAHGNPLHLHFETLLREDGLQRLLSHELETLKMSHFGKKQDPANSVFPKLRSSLLLASRLFYDGRKQLEGTSSRSFPVYSPQAHKHGSLHHPPSLYPATPPAPSPRQIPFTGSSAVVHLMEIDPVLVDLHWTLAEWVVSSSTEPAAPATAIPLASATHFPSSKRRKAECSYDIANVVIPVAAAARVEKPQYKEIVVPSWRIVELEEPEPFHQADSELEDTSDEMYSSHHAKHEDLERGCWGSWAAATSHKRGSRSSDKAQPQPASPVTGFNCLNDSYVHSSTGSRSSEPCGSLQSLSVDSRTRGVLSCSADTRSSLGTLHEAIQSIQPWEPRTFPLSDPAYQGLLQHSNEDGCDQADFQQGLRPTSVDTVIPSFTGMRFSGTQTDGNKSIEEFVVQRCNPGKPVNDDRRELRSV